MRRSTSHASTHRLRPIAVAVVLGLALASLSAAVPAGLLPIPGRSPLVAHAAGSNPIVTENQQPGSTGWQFDYDSSGNPLEASNHEIEGYASLTSVNQGGTISFMVSLSSSAQYTMDVYRMGYYPNGTNPDGSACAGPCGGRLMQHIGPLNGSTQPACPRVTTTTNFGLTECHWATSYTLTVPTTWTTGDYIVKLTRLDTSKEQYMTFVVRNDAAPADLVVSEDVTTWQAYNTWGGTGNKDIGYSLYGEFNDVTYANISNTRAYAVSFDRPYLVSNETDGAGSFMLWDYPVVRWLESKGYNVTYATDIDLESNPNLLSGRKAFINTGHDEYYSDNMRANLKADINAGINVGFFSANNIYYRIQFANDSGGQQYRTIVCYKGANGDTTTLRWRDLTPPQPENAIVGVMQNGVANDRPWEVYNASSWIFQGTGLVNYTSGTPVTSGSGQNAIRGLVGYEFDERADNDASLSSFVSSDPAGLQQVAHSKVPAADNGVAAFSDATVYTASSGATVFAAGTIQWAWGLDDGFNDGFCNCSPGYVSAAAQQITTNILARFLSGPAAPGANLAPTSLSFGSITVGATSAAQTVTLTNNGSGALSITAIGLTGTNAGDFAQTTTCPSGSATLAAGASCTIAVTFTPVASGSRSASLAIADNAAGSPQTVALAGTGSAAAAPAVTLAPTSLSFGSVMVGATSAAQTVTLTNSGTAPLSISSIGLTGTNAADFAQTTTCPLSPSTLAAGANCTIAVTFTPSTASAESASLVVTDNAAGSPQTVALAGTGSAAAAPAVTLAPTSLSFGSVTVGATSAAQTVTLTNSGTAPLSISSIGLTGTNAGDFAQTTTCPSGASTLAAGANCTIAVTFTPVASGSRSASLAIADNAAGSPQTVALLGTGTAAGSYFSDGFESGGFTAWTGKPAGNGQASVENTVVNSGSYAAAFTIASGQYEYMSATLNGGGQAQTYTRFYVRLSGVTASTVLAYGQDSNGNRMWELDYDAGRHGLDAYFWNGARARFDLYSNTNLLALDTWYSVEVQDTESTTGTGQLWLNGTSLGTISGDLSASSTYARLTLYTQAVGTTYWDDVVVSTTYNGPLGGAAAMTQAPGGATLPKRSGAPK